MLIEFVRGNRAECTTATLVLEIEPGTYSKEAEEILRDFYLKIM